MPRGARLRVCVGACTRGHMRVYVRGRTHHEAPAGICATSKSKVSICMVFVVGSARRGWVSQQSGNGLHLKRNRPLEQAWHRRLNSCSKSENKPKVSHCSLAVLASRCCPGIPCTPWPVRRLNCCSGGTRPELW